MRGWRLLGALVIVAGLGLAVFFLKPVRGPERDLTLAADATRGAYVLTQSGCYACHTDIKNDGQPYAGGAPLKTQFGDFVPPNITPHTEAGIGGWTLAQFSDAMSNGTGPGLLHELYPSFPYDNYTQMTDQDLVDLYAALMQVEPVADPAPHHRISFPFSIRAAMLGWKNLFFYPQRFEPDPEKSEQWNRGKYLAVALGHCDACHTPRNMLGGKDQSRAMMGSTGTPGGNVPAITRAALLESGYDMTTLIDALKTGFTPGFDVLGGAMGEVVTNSTSQWTDEDLEALAVYLMDES